MKLASVSRDTRVNVTTAAGLANMHPSHFRRLVSQGVLPQPKRTSKGMPYFDYSLLEQVATVLRTGVGMNGQEVCFYRRSRQRSVAKKIAPSQPSPVVMDVLAACLEVGLATDEEQVRAILVQEFGEQAPDPATAAKVVISKLVNRDAQ